MLPLTNVEYLILHHSERVFDHPSFVRFRHRTFRQWEDIGYHYLIGDGVCTVDGQIYPGRAEQYQGAHARGYNDRSLGICLLGNCDLFGPTDRQIESLLTLLEDKQKQYGIPTDHILGHRELPGVQKTCPGTEFDLDDLRELLRPAPVLRFEQTKTA